MADDILIKIGARDLASKALKKVSSRVGALGNKVSRTVGSLRGLSIAGVGVAGAMSLGVKTFAEFDGAMAKVGAISGATGKDLDALREKAKELGSSTKFSATEAAEGMKFLGMAGFTTKEILDGIGPTLSLAAAGAVELGEAADIASDVSSAYGLMAKDIAKVADVMAVTATSANTDILMMGETFKFVAPIAKAAGQSIEETSVAIGLLGNSGVKASVAGTDLKNILSNLAAPSKAADGAIKRLGLSFKDTSGEFKPLMDIMADFSEKTKDLTGPDKLAEATALFGKRSAKAAIILGDVATPAVEAFRQKMVDSAGEAGKMAATMQNSLAGAGTEIKSAFEGVQISIVESMQEPLREIADGLAESLRSVTEWAKNNKETIAEVGVAFGAAGKVIVGTLTGVAKTLGVVTVGVGKLITAIEKITPSTEDVGRVLAGGKTQADTGKRFGMDIGSRPRGVSSTASQVAPGGQAPIATGNINRKGTTRFGMEVTAGKAIAAELKQARGEKLTRQELAQISSAKVKSDFDVSAQELNTYRNEFTRREELQRRKGETRQQTFQRQAAERLERTLAARGKEEGGLDGKTLLAEMRRDNEPPPAPELKLDVEKLRPQEPTTPEIKVDTSKLENMQAESAKAQGTRDKKRDEFANRDVPVQREEKPKTPEVDTSKLEKLQSLQPKRIIEKPVPKLNPMPVVPDVDVSKLEKIQRTAAGEQAKQTNRIVSALEKKPPELKIKVVR